MRFCAGVVMLWLVAASSVEGALVLDQTNLVSEVEGGPALANGYSQTFTVGLHGKLARIDVQIGKTSGGQSSTTFELRSTSGGLIGGVIFSTSVSVPLVTFAGPQPVTSIDVSSLNLTVNPGDLLAIRFTGGSGFWGNKSNFLPPVPPSNIAVNVSSYDRGTAYDGSFNPISTFDMTFQTFIEPDTETVGGGDPPPFELLQNSDGAVTVDLPNGAGGGEFSAYTGQASLSEVLGGDVSGLVPIDFLLPGNTFQYWNLEYTGTLGSGATVTFSYDESLLLPGTNESALAIYHFHNGQWTPQSGVVDPVNNTITVAGITSFSDWGLGIGAAQVAAVPEPSSFVIFGLSLIGGAVALRRRRLS
jgi:hypothetical protein